jgi:hypothetical protein
MMNSKSLAAELRRDAFFVWRVAIAVVFIAFAGIVVAAALLDLFPIRH